MIKTIFLTPINKFLNIESKSGVLLFSATIIAMIWANSGFADSYQALWATKVSIGSESFGLSKPLILWINDGLMAIFFFLIGLEIKREMLIGELNTIRKATFPIFAAIGGMVIPMAMFLFLNDNPTTTDGWGIPMATDIAFSLAILQLLGKSVPLSLKIFLTAFAIVDDLGAVLVIAIFYSEGIDWMLILYSVLLLGLLFFMSYKGVFYKYFTLLIGIVVWVLFLKSGIHPTIAGVLVAFTIPISRKVNASDFYDKLSYIATSITNSEGKNQTILNQSQLEQIDNLDGVIEDFNSPLQHLEHKLHGLVAYFIMPVFALANAGIIFGSDIQLETALIVNITLALVLGKFLGVFLFSMLAVKLKLAELPEDVRKMQIAGVAILAGVGFTMSIFIGNLAFSSNPLLIDSAKIGILLGSLIAGVLGALILKLCKQKAS